VLSLRLVNMPPNQPGQPASGYTQIGMAFRGVYQVQTPTTLMHWIELTGPSPRVGTAEFTQGNNAIGAVSAVEPSGLTPGADLTIGLSARWQAARAGQVLTFQGSRLYRYVATPVAGSRAYDVLTRRPALI
jgi:hypothetical protein